MADERVTDLAVLTGPPADGDKVHVVDVSDTTHNIGGTSKQITIAELMEFHRPAVYMHSGSTNIVDTSDTVVPFDTETLDPNSGYSVSAGVITVAVAGFYSVAYSIPIADDGETGATRAAVKTRVQRDTGGGFSDIPQGHIDSYSRENGGGTGVSGSFICQLTAGDDIRVLIITSNSTDISTVSGQSQISIHRIS